jgi:hypothetical protein
MNLPGMVLLPGIREEKKKNRQESGERYCENIGKRKRIVKNRNAPVIGGVKGLSP